MKLYLGDLVHTWEKASTWTFPLNIGFIAAYAKKHMGENLEVRLFKRPDKMIEAIKSDPPDVVGLGYYVWNANLNGRVAQVAKQADPDMLVVGGGPNFTSLNTTEEHALAFFASQPEVDAYVVNQGERGFLEVLRAYRDDGLDTKKLRARTIDGCVVRNPDDAHVQIGPALDPIRDLDEIPSPYLNGMLDEFFDEPFAPVLETNRACPYRCTFCAWGIGTSKLAQFSLERVLAEIDYIGKRCRNAAQMFIADANFGVLERDADIARALSQSHKTHGFPGHLAVQWHKNRPDRIINAAREVKDIARVGASMQSFNPDTLAAVKRKNLPLEKVVEMHAELNADGKEMPLVSELILGLPEETRESHLEANRIMIDAGAEVYNYNLYLLPGTEMDSPESRAKYFTLTNWRLQDNAFGIYDGVKVFEGQEMVQETPTMPREDLRWFRFYHFLQQFMWGSRWYYDYIVMMRELGVHPVDMIKRIRENFPHKDGDLGRIYQAFEADHDLEHFDSFEELAAYWSQDEPFERLRTGDYGKLNFVFTYKVLIECREAFDDFLLEQAQAVFAEQGRENRAELTETCRDVLDFGSALQIRLTDDMELVRHHAARFNHDILTWRENGYAGQPDSIDGGSIGYDFTIGDQQRNKLERLLNQYRSHNKNLTLRKMSEYIKPHEFFYTPTPARAAQ